ncbi:MAG: hypothetical protein NT141_02120 [candidate division WWE3 bacterium]|nr:hypothetical protein [candidate division WWE3 bacterium]
MKKTTILLVIALGLVIAGWFLLRSKGSSTPSKNSEASSSAMILFYGDGCPHCKNVDDFVATVPNLQNKLGYSHKEVFLNKDNAATMLDKAKTCKLDTTQGMGVPFLWTGSACVEGDTDIINFFKSKL